MTTIERFEDINAWQKARQLADHVYAVTCDGAFEKDYGLKDQIRRAAVSVMSNIAEGFGRAGNREFVQFLSVAKGSASEVQAQLYVALDAGYISKEQFNELYDLANDTSGMIGGFIRYLSNSKYKGLKYK